MNLKSYNIGCCKTVNCNNTCWSKGLCKSCYNKSYRKTHNLNKYKTYNKYHRSLKGQYNSLKASAKRRVYEVELTFEEFALLRATNKCHYCGAKLPTSGSGIDRKDNHLGYCLDNVVACCAICNDTKSDKLNYKEMINLMEFRKINKLGEINL